MTNERRVRLQSLPALSFDYQAFHIFPVQINIEFPFINPNGPVAGGLFGGIFEPVEVYVASSKIEKRYFINWKNRGLNWGNLSKVKMGKKRRPAVFRRAAE